MIRKFYFKIAMCCAMIWILILTGCSGDRTGAEKLTKLEYEETEKTKTEIYIESPETDTEPETDVFLPEPELVEADWSEYSDGLNGAAVIYDVSELRYTVYNRELALTQSSPCSTFKIISSLIALEQRIIPSGDSTRTWSGEVFWNEKWNRDIDFESSFRDSCVWYFRQVIDDIGQERMQEELYKLQYGNCDISDWEGRLNTNNNRALTGFWIESSLAISPKEQTEVMERIFGTDSVYSEETQNRLRQVMLVTEQNQASASIYGKTGMGRANGSIDAWFTGFAEHGEKKVYFCVYLGKSDDENISSTAAKKIAIRLVTDYFKN